MTESRIVKTRKDRLALLDALIITKTRPTQPPRINFGSCRRSVGRSDPRGPNRLAREANPYPDQMSRQRLPTKLRMPPLDPG
jgi:hypothetical protein